MAGLRILLVAPDPFVQGTIEQALRDALGLAVIKKSAYTSGDPLYSDTGSAPSLVIVDAHEASAGAKSVIRALKQEGRTVTVPVILLAPRGGNRLTFECLQMGANAALEAPVNTDELVGTIWWLLRDRLFNYLGWDKQAIPAVEASPPPLVESGAGCRTPKPPGRAGAILPDTETAPKPGTADVPTDQDQEDGGDAFPPTEEAIDRNRLLEDSSDDGPATRMRLFGYELESVLGSGGMATVYKAAQVSLERPVAIKVIARDLAESEEFSARFIREARVQASLSHPNIVQVYDLGSGGPLLYIVMELVEGTSLKHWIEEKSLTPLHWMYVAHVLGETLSYLHSKKVIHRDVKPANLLIGRDGAMKLSDFGITYRPEGKDTLRLTKGDFALGTPFFMSPEQRLNPAIVNPRVDVFAAAVLLHVMIVGGITMHPLPPLQEYRPELPPAIDAALRPGLEFDAERRARDIRNVTNPFIEAVRKFVETSTGRRIDPSELYRRNPFTP